MYLHMESHLYYSYGSYYMLIIIPNHQFGLPNIMHTAFRFCSTDFIIIYCVVVFNLISTIFYFDRYQQILAVNTGLAAVKEIYPATLTNYPCCPTASSRCLMTVGSSLYGQIEQRLTTQVVLRQTGRCKAGRPKYQPVIVTDLSVGCHCAVPYVEPDNLPEEDRLMEAKTQLSNEVTDRD